MAAGDRGNRGRSEYGGRDRAGGSFGGRGGSNRDRHDFGSIGDHQSYGMSEKDFNETIGRDRDRDRGGDNRDSSPAPAPDSGSGSDVGSATPAEDPSRRGQYGRYSTPSPIGGPSSYGISEDTYDNIAEPHQPNAPDRYESWARDVLARNAAGQAPSAREKERLESGVQGYRGQQVANVASGVAGLANPYAGAAIQGAFGLASQLASPEFQAGTALADESTVSGTLGSLGSTLAGALGNPGLGTAAKVAGTFGSPVEQGFSRTGQLVGDIEQALGGRDRARNAFSGGGGRGGDNRDYTYGGTSPTVTGQQPQQPQQSGFQAADPYNYSTFLNNFTVG